MMTMASDGDVLTGLWFDGQKYFPNFTKEKIKEKKLPIFERTEKWLDIYFSGKEPDFRPDFLRLPKQSVEQWDAIRSY